MANSVHWTFTRGEELVCEVDGQPATFEEAQAAVKEIRLQTLPQWYAVAQRFVHGSELSGMTHDEAVAYLVEKGVIPAKDAAGSLPRVEG